jgi:hypothetical protein
MKMRTRTIKAIGAAIGVAALALIGLAIRPVDHSRAQPSPGFGSAPMGISFAPLSTNSAQPSFPGGSTGLSLQEALSAASRHAMASTDPLKIPGVNYRAAYGLFSDSQLTQTNAAGVKFHPFLGHRAWVVHYFGPGVNIPSERPFGSHFAPLYAQEVTVVVDAATGRFMETYIG